MHPVQAYAALQAKGNIVPHIIQRRSPKDHDVVIDIYYCGICHSDIHQVNGDWGPKIFPMGPGHEITGVVKHIGSKSLGSSNVMASMAIFESHVEKGNRRASCRTVH